MSFLFDECDMDIYTRHKWRVYNYVSTVIDGKTKYFHRVILGEPELNVDHINGNPLDNRRRNLRLCSQSQNMMNARKRKGTTSKYKGVSFRRDTGKWASYIHVGGIKVNLGCYHTEEEAAARYNISAFLNYGEFALLNKMGR